MRQRNLEEAKIFFQDHKAKRGRGETQIHLWHHGIWSRGDQPVAQDVNAARHKKIINLLKTFFFFAHQFSLVFVYLMCAQDNSSSSVAQRCQKVGYPWTIMLQVHAISLHQNYFYFIIELC